MKSSNYIARRIKQETDIAFGVTGGCIVNLVDSLHKEGVKIIPMHHEQSAAMAADAYARISGELGVCFSTSGPGATNLITGTCCSWFDSVPVLTIAGQVPAKHLKKGKLRQFGFQEVDSVSLFKPITKFAKRVKNIERDLEKAITIAKENRKGPTFLELCDDTQRKDIKGELNFYLHCFRTPIYKKKHIVKFIDLLCESKRPLLIIGAGVRGSEEEMRNIINELGIPVLLTWGAMDLLPDNHDLYIRDFGVTAHRTGNLTVQNADLIIALGTRLDTHKVPNYSMFAPKAKKIIVDIDKSELKKQKADLKIHSELNYFLKKLEKRLKSEIWCFASWFMWHKKIKRLQQKYPICKEYYWEQKNSVNPYCFIDKLSDKAKEKDIIVIDMGQAGCWALQGWKVKEGQRVFSAFNHSPMGYSIPASIGAQFAKPESNVICIIGEGSLMMNIQELQTIITNKLPIKIFVLNNNIYGMIQQTQSDWEVLKDGVACNEQGGLTFPNILKIAKAFGFKTAEINTHKDFEKIPKILKNSSSTITVVKIKDGERIQPKLKWGDKLDNQSPHLTKKQLEEANKILK